MPTGGGKSLCFQVPALAMEGLCLVVSPLIALMRDQVENLRSRDIKAAAIFTGLTLEETHAVLDNCRFGDYKFLYLSPERLESAEFRRQLNTLPVSMIAVDEAHCISQWGYDFRPSYLRIAEIRELFPEAPVLALTATATPDVIDDIQERLLFREKNVLRRSFQRENLSYVVRHADNKLAELIHILRSVAGSSIVYVRNRQKTKEVAQILDQEGISATHFHAGLKTADKQLKQDSWKQGKYRVIVATNAFGMGIDKPDVRTVIHLDLPDTIEAYFQEAGRAGRDGKRAYCVLLVNDQDKQKLHKRVSDTYPDQEFIAKVYQDAADWLEVGAGSGLGHSFQFPLDEFCRDRHLPMLPTYSALQLLAQAGLIAWTDEQESRPRLMMLTTKEELYHSDLTQQQESIINSLFRRYTGIFAEPQYIDDELVSNELGISLSELSEQLVMLARRSLLLYIPRSHTPYLTYTREREVTERVYIPDSVYEQRRKLYVEKLRAMEEYATQTQFCRSQLLLAYFGETDAPPCGECDVCKRKKIEN